MWALIDNYDSFTWMLYDYLLQAGGNCRVFRNDEITVDELKAMQPERIIISPGPETPLQAGITMEVIRQFYKTTPILGICLGHQAIGMHFGASLKHASYPMHGKTSEVTHNQHRIFDAIPSPFAAMRYHSLVIDSFEGTGLAGIAAVEGGANMAVAHNVYPCIGLQFHPESVGTPYGLQMLRNWANMQFAANP